MRPILMTVNDPKPIEPPLQHHRPYQVQLIVETFMPSMHLPQQHDQASLLVPIFATRYEQRVRFYANATKDKSTATFNVVPAFWPIQRHPCYEFCRDRSTHVICLCRSSFTKSVYRQNMSFISQDIGTSRTEMGPQQAHPETAGNRIPH